MTNSRQKGKRIEREIANAYRAAGFRARRGQQHQGSPDSPDVVVEDFPRLHVEAKGGAAIRLWEAIEQARRDAGQGRVPVVHIRRNHWPTYVVLSFDHWIEVLQNGMEALGAPAAKLDGPVDVVHLGEVYAIEENQP